MSTKSISHENIEVYADLTSSEGPDSPKLVYYPQMDDGQAETGKHNIVDFSDAIPGKLGEYKPNKQDNFYDDALEEMSISHFFSRPFEVARYNLNALSSTRIPLEAYFNNAMIKEKLARYRNLKCDVHLKVVVNGIPQQYGRFIVGCVPPHDELLAPGPNTFIQVQLTQCRHTLLNPTISQGGELILPYLHFANSHSLVDGSLKTWSGTYNPLGTAYIAPLAPMAALSGFSLDCYTTVYMWLENVVLSGPTMIAQSGRTDEEASNIQQFVVRDKPNFATVDDKDLVFKSSLSSKQQVDTSPSTVGYQEKEKCTIFDIASRPSLLGSFNWAHSDPGGSMLGSIEVNPTSCYKSTTLANVFVPTPLAYATLPFKYWRGGLRYHFSAVCSSFHRGRLRISFDPAGFLMTAGSVDSYSHLNYSYIWDLAEKQELTVDIGYMNNLPFLKVKDLNDPFAGRATVPVLNQETANGRIGIMVDNALTAGTDTSIPILVYVSALPDYKVFGMTERILGYEVYNNQLPVAQSGMLPQVDVAMIESPSDVTFGRIYDDPTILSTFGGENIDCLYKLMSRYIRNYILVPKPIGSTTTNGYRNTQFIHITVPARPIPRLRGIGSIYPRAFVPNATTSIAANPVCNTLITWFSILYHAQRGGYRMRICDETRSRSVISTAHIARNIGAYWMEAISYYMQPEYSTSIDIPLKQRLLYPSVQPPTGSPTYDRIQSCLMRGGNVSKGGAVVSSFEAMDIEVPFYLPWRYNRNRILQQTLIPEQPILDIELSCNLANTSGNSLFDSAAIGVYFSIADDFTLYGFVCTPVLLQQPFVTFINSVTTEIPPTV